LVEVANMTCRCSSEDGGGLRVGIYKCPGCGHGVRIFSDEANVVCAQCGGTVNREELAPCVDWCADADRCLGVHTCRGSEDSGALR